MSCGLPLSCAGEEEEEGESEEEHEDIFELEGMNELDINADPETYERMRQEQAAARGGWEGAAVAHGSAGAVGEASTSGRPHVDETANKLDSMMELMFAHLQRRAEQAGGMQQLWDTLLGIFERTILNTHRSKFTQYILFFICCKAPDVCSRTFIEFLFKRLKVCAWGRFGSKGRPDLQLACAYSSMNLFSSLQLGNGDRRSIPLLLLLIDQKQGSVFCVHVVTMVHA